MEEEKNDSNSARPGPKKPVLQLYSLLNKPAAGAAYIIKIIWMNKKRVNEQNCI